jgi:hypothetical protein
MTYGKNKTKKARKNIQENSENGKEMLKGSGNKKIQKEVCKRRKEMTQE